MSAPIISVSNLSKVYRLGVIGSRTLKDDFARAWARLRGQPDPLLKLGDARAERREGNIFWALSDVSFEVHQGDILGIIGKNGAGKSTLLKIISRITAPSTGFIRINGRIGSLLEVGTGFHPELTGRENIFLNGAILGMSRAEIRGKLDEIIAFSGVEEFIDTPVKRYSSGTYVRLAFSVAAHLEPEILVLDEVLAVGDAVFQRKCLGKMSQVAHQGRTVLFVSHNMVAVQSLCTRGLLLEDGRIKVLGSVDQAVTKHLESVTQSRVMASEREWPDVQKAPGNDYVKLAAIRVRPATPTPDGLIRMETPVLIEICYHRVRRETVFHLNFHLVNQQEVIVLTTSTARCPAPLGRYVSRCVIPGDLLNSGDYRLRLYVIKDGTGHDWADEFFAAFTVVDMARREAGWMGREPCAVLPKIPWTTELAAAS